MQVSAAIQHSSLVDSPRRLLQGVLHCFRMRLLVIKQPNLHDGMKDLMSSTTSVRAIGNGVLAKVDGFLFSLHLGYRAAGVLLLQGLLFYAYSLSGPWIPLGIFYLLNLYFTAKYVGGRYAYLLAIFAAGGKTLIKIGFFPEDAQWWQAQWQFVSSLSIYLMFCYLMNLQLKGLRHAEAALDKLSTLNEAIVTNTDSAMLVFKESGECIIVNDAAARIFGKTVQQLSRLNYLDAAGWSEAQLLEAAQVTMQNGVEFKFSTRIAGDNRRVLWCIASVRRIRSSMTSYLLMALTDITAHKEAEDAIQRADKETAVALARAGIAERKLLNISEETQQRIGRELHDDLGQRLTGVAFMSEVLFQRLKDEKSQELQHAAKITALVNEALSRTRVLAQGLYPAELTEKGFAQMMGKFADYLSGIYQVECEFDCPPECQIEDTEIAINLFRITQEAATNAVKHGKATRLELHFTSISNQCALLEILDNGSGIVAGGSESAGLGLRTMRYRAEMIGATLDISARENGGTRVAVQLPLTHKMKNHDAQTV